MKKIIDESTSGRLNVILTEIVASFMFICLIYEKVCSYLCLAKARFKPKIAKSSIFPNPKFRPLIFGYHNGCHKIFAQIKFNDKF